MAPATPSSSAMAAVGGAYASRTEPFNVLLLACLMAARMRPSMRPSIDPRLDLRPPFLRPMAQPIPHGIAQSIYRVTWVLKPAGRTPKPVRLQAPAPLRPPGTGRPSARLAPAESRAIAATTAVVTYAPPTPVSRLVAPVPIPVHRVLILQPTEARPAAEIPSPAASLATTVTTAAATHVWATAAPIRARVEIPARSARLRPTAR